MPRHRAPQRPRPARIYVLYEGWDGEPSVQWQLQGAPCVPGALRLPNGRLYPPTFRWVVRARSATQACDYVRHAKRASGPRSFGILWDCETDYPDSPPLGDGVRWAVVTYCGEPRLQLCECRWLAEQVLHGNGCGNIQCHHAREIVLMTADEARRCQPAWRKGS